MRSGSAARVAARFVIGDRTADGDKAAAEESLWRGRGDKAAVEESLWRARGIIGDRTWRNILQSAPLVPQDGENVGRLELLRDGFLGPAIPLFLGLSPNDLYMH